jgi:hypothetical protein
VERLAGDGGGRPGLVDGDGWRAVADVAERADRTCTRRQLQVLVDRARPQHAPACSAFALDRRAIVGGVRSRRGDLRDGVGTRSH